MAKRSDHVLSEGTKREMANRAGGDAASTRSDENAAALIVPSAASGGVSIVNALNAILSQDDGWLRVVPADGGKTLWLKWKFNAGRNNGTYVMVKGSQDDTLDYLFGLLFDKVDWARKTGLGVVVDHYHSSVFR